MPVTQDIVESYRRPREVMRRHLRRGRSEPFAFSLLAAFLLLAFVAQWPRLSRQAVELPEVPMVQGLVGTGLALLATIPAFYALAGLSHLVARLVSGKGSFYAARLALFMALLAAAPLVLLQGLVVGLLNNAAQSLAVGAVAFAAFLWMWMAMLIEAETWT
jgi:hypothetical protein